MNGKNAAPIYKFLKSQKGGIFGDGIKWNFTKFLVNKEGKVVERYAPTTSPLKIEVRTNIFPFFFLFIFDYAQNCRVQLIVISFPLAERHPESIGIILSTKV